MTNESNAAVDTPESVVQMAAAIPDPAVAPVAATVNDNGGVDDAQDSTKFADIKIGGTDAAGCPIVDVLSSQKDFCIYEIKIGDDKRLKVLIDSNDKSSDDLITKRYNDIRETFILATEVSDKARNKFSAKSMIAQALSYHLIQGGSDTKKSQQFFKSIVKVIKNQTDHIPKRRILYLSPFWIITYLYLYLILHSGFSSDEINNLSFVQKIHCMILSATIGGMLSATININKAPIEYVASDIICVLLGLERFFISVASCTIAFIAIQSGYIIPSLNNGSFFGTMIILVAAAFSEKFIPSFLEKVENQVEPGMDGNAAQNNGPTLQTVSVGSSVVPTPSPTSVGT